MPFEEPWYRFGRILRAFEETAVVCHNLSWLDLGCHQGQFVKLLREKYGVMAMGVDNWDPGLKSDDSWGYVQANIEAGIPLDDNFDVVSALEVIEHMIDTDAFLQRCNRLVKSGGHLILSTPNINSLRNRVLVPFGAYPVGIEFRNVIHHVRLYNVTTLKSHLAEHGFRIVSITGVSFLPTRFLHYPLLRRTSEGLADFLPAFCNNFIAIAQKV